MKTYTEFFEKAQSEFLSGLKEAQELNVKVLESFTALSMPSPSEIVERSFALTTDVLEAQKAYAVKLAELATETQKQFADAAKRAADAARN